MLACFGLAAPVQAQATPEAGAQMRAAMAAVVRREWDPAASLAPQGVGRDIVEWHRLRAGEGLLGDYEAFLTRHPDWPGLDLLRRRGEVAVARSDTPARVIAYFNGNPPVTPGGSMALIRALSANGQGTAAGSEAARAWVGLDFDAEDEAAMLTLAGAALAPLHEARLDRLLWEGEAAQARRMLPRVSAGWRALAEARMALRAQGAGVDQLVAAVPRTLAADPGLAYERFVWRHRKGLTDGAVDLLLERSVSPASLGQPERWARRRAILVRELMKDGKASLAYSVAASHQLTEGGDYATLEFLAGYVALRRMNRIEVALKHFGHLREGVSTAISVSRAHYWEARAEAAAGRNDRANAAYAVCAQHQTAYYGLLCAEALGRSLDPALLADAPTGDWRRAGFAGGSLSQAAQLLVATGESDIAKRFFLELADRQADGNLALVADMALALGEPHSALVVAKRAAARGVILPRAYFPVVGMVPDGLPVSRALALSIARRESEFNPIVQSGAGARGLMQLMPGTAKQMAGKTGQDYALSRLTSDPAFNVSLGSAYLAQLVEDFGPAVALVAAGYNAGPSRPKRWITEYGDPRQPGVDVVDWVESIPFEETRTYVMRVVESLVIYRARLRGSVGPVRVISELTGR